MVIALLAMTLAAPPTLVRVDMSDALRLPGGFESPAPKPLVLLLRVPPSWVSGGALTDTARRAVLARLYGGPDWEQGNEDGSTYVVKHFTSRVITSLDGITDTPQTYWYEVNASGALEKKGPRFGAPAPPRPPVSLEAEAIPGSKFKQGPSLEDASAALAWLGQQRAPVKLAVTLRRGAVGFVGRDARAGSLTFRCEDAKLGVSLADRARQACEDAATCELWLVGRWGKEKDGFVLDVLEVDGSPSGAERSLEMTRHAWVQTG